MDEELLGRDMQRKWESSEDALKMVETTEKDLEYYVLCGV